MWTITMNMNALHGLTIYVSSDMASSIDDHALFSSLSGMPCKSSTKQACSNNQIIIFLHFLFGVLIKFQAIVNMA